MYRCQSACQLGQEAVCLFKSLDKVDKSRSTPGLTNQLKAQENTSINKNTTGTMSMKTKEREINIKKISEKTDDSTKCNHYSSLKRSPGEINSRTLSILNLYSSG